MPIGVSLNGVDYVSLGVGYTYHDDLKVTGVAPSSVPDEGGATVTVFGEGFLSAATGQLAVVRTQCSGLKAAVSAWSKNATTAESKHGHIRGWDTSEVSSILISSRRM